ncbi:hypothetical protein DX931_24905 [Bacillus cereus]|nr:hypothetical protein DX931_24905 [Bacillus cereus]
MAINYEFLIVCIILFEDTALLEEDSIRLRNHIISKKGSLLLESYLNVFYTEVERNYIELVNIYMGSGIPKLGLGYCTNILFN